MLIVPMVLVGIIASIMTIIHFNHITSAKSVIQLEDSQLHTVQFLSYKKMKIEKKDDVHNARNKNTKKVYLTFDDGPSQWTGSLLDVLKEHRIQATFFMVGSNLKKSNLQHDVERAISEGHYVGAHSMTHDYEHLYRNKQFVSEMEETITLIQNITNTTPNLVRAPYGSLPGLRNKEILSKLKKAKLKIWDWTVDSQDWKFQSDGEKILDILKESVYRDVEVILLHEKEQTLKMLPQIIDFFHEEGYSFEVYKENDHFPCNFMGDEEL